MTTHAEENKKKPKPYAPISFWFITVLRGFTGLLLRKQTLILLRGIDTAQREFDYILSTFRIPIVHVYPDRMSIINAKTPATLLIISR